MIIKNLSQLKKAMQVGRKVRFTNVNQGVEMTAIRECKIAQKDSFALDNSPFFDDKNKISWLYYPKAKDIQFIQEEGKPTKVKFKGLMSNEHYLIYELLD